MPGVRGATGTLEISRDRLSASGQLEQAFAWLTVAAHADFLPQQVGEFEAVVTVEKFAHAH